MIFLKDFINLEDCAVKASQALNIEMSKTQTAFEIFFYADERSDFWYYTSNQCQQVINEMVQEFIDDHIKTKPTFAAVVAAECGLELLNESKKERVHPGWINV